MECGKNATMFVKRLNMRGFLLVDKGKGITSFDVVHKVRKWSGEKRVGHAGTLDPLATGLLLVAVGEATKLLEYFVGMDKEYEVRAKFGAVSDTYDAEGKIEVLEEKGMEKYSKFSKKDLEKLIESKFIGEIEQIPPKYSALKINGKRAMDLARKGEKFEMKGRKVMIYDLKVKEFDWPEVVFRVRCGSGTYIRSLVHDIGQEVGCGAYVQELRRVSVDKYSVDGANVVVIGRDFDCVNKKIEQRLMSLEQVSERFDSIYLTDKQLEELGDGKTIESNKIIQRVPTLASYQGKVIGIIENGLGGSGLKIRKLIR